MILPVFVTTYTYPARNKGNGECVVLLHGIFTTSIRLTRMHRRLHQEGYTVLSVTYPSRHMHIRDVAQHLAAHLGGLPSQFSNVHMVGFSMGGLIGRAYLARDDAISVQRLVCIGTPNQGTEFVDELHRQTYLARLFRWLAGPPGDELGSKYDDGSFARECGSNAPANTQTGVIAGHTSWSLWIHLPKPHDGYVPVERTKLDGMCDFIEVPYGHVQLPFRRRVVEEVVSFVKVGQFTHESVG